MSVGIRIDNVAALTTLTKMHPNSPTLGIIARELALDVAAAAYCPDDAPRIPSISDKSADYLGRVNTPRSTDPTPTYLPPNARHKFSVRSRE